MTDYKDLVIELFQKGEPIKNITSAVSSYFPNLEREQVRGKVRAIVRKLNHPSNATATPTDTEKCKVSYKDGETTFEGIIALQDGEPITPEIIMRAHNLDPDEWVVRSFTSNAWQSQVKDGNKMTLWQSKITVAPRRATEITFADIDDYFAKAQFDLPKRTEPYEITDTDTILEIDYADAHYGLLSWQPETGANYDLEIAARRFKTCICDIVKRARNKTFSKIVFATLGDILHIDHEDNTTTKGTLQQADGRIAKIYDTAIDVMVDTICELETLGLPIEYIYCSGNHDRNTGYYLAKALEMYFRNDKQITFDISPNPKKAFTFGVNLIGLCHGDMPKKNLGEWLQKTYRKEFGQSRFAEVHCGHLHSESVKENCGVLVKNLPAICENSFWEAQQGYVSERGVMCFVWDKKKGLRETWYNYL